MSQQFVVYVEDRPGALSRLTHELAVRGVDIHHIAAVGSGAMGYVILTVDRDDLARNALTTARYRFHEGESLMVAVEDRPGALAEVTERLAASGVNIHSMIVQGRRDGRVELALTVDDLATARRTLGL